MVQLFIIIGLILLNGLFSMSEIAIISARRSKLEKDSKKGNKSAKTALKLATDPDIFLSTIQIGITLIGILTGLFSGDALANDLGAILQKCGIDASLANNLAQISILIIVTYLTLVIGELVPKRIGMATADRIARIMARPVYLLSVITKPIVWILAKSTAIIVVILGIKQDDNNVTEDDIKSIIQEGTEAGEVQKVEQDIVERVFLMGDMKVSSIMTHRSDIVWININASAKDVETLIHNNLHDYYPVANNQDIINSFVSLKDIIRTINNDDFAISKIMQPAMVFHENMSLYNGLEKLKTDGHIGCALVFDEYGSCQGIITLRDILEGLVGMVNTEHQEPQIIARDNNNGWLIDGQCSFYDFMVYFALEDDIEDSDYNTISGLILSRLEHIPQSGESVTWRNFKLEVVDMDGPRIDKVLAIKSIQ